MSDIAIVMGSKSDLISLKGAFDILNRFGVGFTARVISAHRTPDAAAEFAKNAEADGYRVIICAAGMAAHLAGVIAAHTTQRMVGSNGDVYLVKSDKNGYTITNETKKDSMQLAFDEQTNEWSCTHNGETRKLLRVNEDARTLTVYTPQGETVEVSNNEEGIKELQALLDTTPLMAE